MTSLPRSIPIQLHDIMKTSKPSQYFPFYLVVALAALASATWPPMVRAEEAGKGTNTNIEQRLFDSPEDASKALVAAATTKDRSAMRELFGPECDDLVTGDEVLDAALFERFCKNVKVACRLSRKSDVEYGFEIGADRWPFPIPVAKKDGHWFFDTKAGQEEIVSRHIGEDELNAIEVCRDYVEAQREYAAADRDKSDVLKYAKLLWSSPGKKDGLYWKTGKDEAASPLAPIVRQAVAEGYDHDSSPGNVLQSHGYIFKIITQQGADAPGGKYDYIINDNMIAGFALMAYPDTWGKSGVMTFIVNQRGKVFQRDLGPKTEELAAALTEYNPDHNWTLVKERGEVGE